MIISTKLRKVFYLKMFPKTQSKGNSVHLRQGESYQSGLLIKLDHRVKLLIVEQYRA